MHSVQCTASRTVVYLDTAREYIYLFQAIVNSQSCTSMAQTVCMQEQESIGQNKCCVLYVPDMPAQFNLEKTLCT